MTSRDRFRTDVSSLPALRRPIVQPLPPVAFTPRPIPDPPYTNAGR